MKILWLIAVVLPLGALGQPLPKMKKVPIGDRIVEKRYYYEYWNDLAYAQMNVGEGKVDWKPIAKWPPSTETLDIEVKDPFWISPTEVSNGEYLAFLVSSVFDAEEQKQYWQFMKTGEEQHVKRWTGRLKDRAREKGIYPDSWDSMDFLTNSASVVQISNFHNFPVTEVSWDQAMAYCEWLNQLPKAKAKGWNFRLPSEAEWIWAAHGGLEAVDLNQTQPEPLAFSELPYFSTNDVDGGLKNGFGLYNMGGNVAEWTLDDWEGPGMEYPLMSEERIAQMGKAKIIKGGWVNAEEYAFNVGSRRLGRQATGYQTVGFRVAAVKE